MNRRALLVSAVAVAALGGLGASYVLNNRHVADSLAVGGPFKLIGTDGQEVTEAAVKGKYSLFFFGFTFCPDACPTALNTFTLVLSKLGADADKIQPVFVSIDPERDKPAVLKEYLTSFDPRIMGLTGTPEEIAETAKKFRVYYAKQGEGEFYLMDHSTAIIVMNPDFEYAGVLAGNMQPDEMVTRLKELLAQGA
ncbi:SCO family protein [Dongia rigui]|uniref:SCO family protein n=1 Tax=Dongia rigui TaxID=940149 RepID=A0ABU5DWN0_9PROT|nr:SCO family protein [Dongia rigui]MDY0871718.1 SCO family protein [Dongia rigui]